jgi:hypothetical protein
MAVQNLQRLAAAGMVLRHSGQRCSAASVFRAAMTVIRLAGTTTK